MSDAAWMAQALELAALGLNTTAPNPRVGCVIVRDGVALAKGWHRAAGEPHAEALALERAGDRARGSSVYVSLEPCAHQQRTPPCADALVAAGVRRVVVAMRDPNPRVDGRGIAQLRDAGIAVSLGCRAQEAEALNAGFFRRMRAGLPWVRVKLAMSLDGRTADPSGASQWITGPSARADGQRLRARSCAIITGVGTVLADDPRLTVRTGPPGARQPLRAVMDSTARTPADAKIWRAPGETVLFTAGATPNPHCQAVPGPDAPNDKASPEGALRWLAKQRACNEVLIEAGATLSGAFLRAGLVDELVLYVAPLLLGSTAKPLLDWQAERLVDGMALDVRELRALDRGWRLLASPAPGASDRAGR